MAKFQSEYHTNPRFATWFDYKNRIAQSQLSSLWQVIKLYHAASGWVSYLVTWRNQKRHWRVRLGMTHVDTGSCLLPSIDNSVLSLCFCLCLSLFLYVSLSYICMYIYIYTQTCNVYNIYTYNTHIYIWEREMYMCLPLPFSLPLSLSPSQIIVIFI